MPTLPSGPSHVFPHHITPHQAEKEQQENRKHFHQRTIKVARSTVKVGILSLFHLSLPKLYCFTFSLLKEALGITLLHLLKKKKKCWLQLLQAGFSLGSLFFLPVGQDMCYPRTTFLVTSFKYQAQICFHYHSDTQITRASANDEKY